jgi:hypothetical protein
MRSSSDWMKDDKGKWARATVNKTRGLNVNHNHLLKNVFKGYPSICAMPERT